MNLSDLPNIRNTLDLSKYLACSEGRIEELLAGGSQRRYYEEIKIPKKNLRQIGKFRTVYSPEVWLAQIQKEIATMLSSECYFPEYVQGFVKGGSTVKNAKFHLERKFLLNIDIKNFFESITSIQVESIFVELGCTVEVAKILTALTTIDGFLKQGLPSSPVLANLVAKQLDIDLLNIAKEHKAVYTRYADDITYSSDISTPLKGEIENILFKNGFLLNKDKFRLRKRGQAQFVTGLSVFDSNYPRIPKRFKRRFRLEIFYILKYSLQEHLDRKDLPGYALRFEMNSLQGKIDYINAVEPLLAQKIRDKLKGSGLVDGFSVRQFEILAQALTGSREERIIAKAEKILGYPIDEWPGFTESNDAKL